MTGVKLTILGSGTSQGVPAIGCKCETCTSDDPRDSRTRPSAMFSINGSNFLIDTSADFRVQALRHDIMNLDAVLYTHHHFDHIGGFDDIRSYNFLQGGPVNIYGMERTLNELKTTFRYAFGAAEQEGGGIPQVNLHAIPDTPGSIHIAGIDIDIIPVLHVSLRVLGFRAGTIAYVTDASDIPQASFDRLQGLDVLVLNALRHQSHPTHYNLEESIATAGRIGARRTYFTHMAHDIKHGRDSALLPDGIAFAYDGLVIKPNGSVL